MSDQNGLGGRVLAAMASQGRDVLRVVNAGTLEEELWTDDDWKDEYADELERVLGSLVDDGLLVTGDIWGEKTYSLSKAAFDQQTRPERS